MEPTPDSSRKDNTGTILGVSIAVVVVLVVIICVLPICIIAILTLLGPSIGNVFSNVIEELVTATPIP